MLMNTTVADQTATDIPGKAGPAHAIPAATLPVKPSPVGRGGHIPTLDGLRGVAILMVLFVHFNQEALLKLHYPVIGPIITKVAQMGLKGVDLFFVLSGFLITGILLDSKGTEGFFRKFYARRFLRIFPLYYGSLLIVLYVLPRLVSFDAPAHAIADKQIWLWTYLSNVPGVSPGWDKSDLIRLGHFWSLCVEEHFYLLWPIIVAACSPRWLVRVSLALIAMAMVFGGVHAVLGDGAFWITRWTSVTYVDALVCGGLLALIVRDPRLIARTQPWAQGAVLILGIAFVGISLVPRAFHPDMISYLRKTVSTFLFAAILFFVATPGMGKWLSGILSSSFLRAFGKYSYGLYVIHNILLPSWNAIFPPETLIAICRVPMVGLAAHMSLVIGASLVLAMASWHLYESQFLKLKRFVEYELAPGQTALAWVPPTDKGTATR